MVGNELLELFQTDEAFSGTFDVVRKNRHNATCHMDAWYIQAKNTTYALAILVGSHGVREDIPALRTYHIIEGDAVFTIDEKEHKVNPGSKIEIQPHSTYDFHSIGEDRVVVFVNVGLKLDLDAIPSK